MQLPQCNYRHPIPGRAGMFCCTHPRIMAHDDLVTAELCRMCQERESDAPAKAVCFPLPTVSSQRAKTIAVIIVCHNYGRFLAEAIESVLGQTRRPEEMLVVDDASHDDTREVAARFASVGVRYLRVEEYHSQRARRAGWLATTSDVVMFLDADDALAPDYLARGLAAFDEVRVGVVYSDVQYFGDRRGRTAYPDTFDRGRLARHSYLHNGCLVRREALNISRALDVINDDRQSLQDWLLWRRVLDFGWQARKQSGLYRYRQHLQSLTARSLGGKYDYFARASLALETVTLFVPLAGRAHLWPGMAAFLDRQKWPHEQTRLVLFDTSQDAAFSQMVRAWVAGCDYADVRHWRQAVGAAGLADLPRRPAAREVSLAMTRIYNRLAREATTDYVWIVEDDIVPPLDACEHLLRGFDRQTASVSGVYLSRVAERFVAWHGRREIEERGSGYEQVDGNGFGCVVLRGQLLRETLFTASIDAPGYDTAFYRRLPATGLKAKVDWSVECEHHVEGSGFGVQGSVEGPGAGKPEASARVVHQPEA